MGQGTEENVRIAKLVREWWMGYGHQMSPGSSSRD